LWIGGLLVVVSGMDEKMSQWKKKLRIMI